MAKRASPGVNVNLPNTPEPEAVQRALANEIVVKEAILLLTEKRKSLRKTAEGEGVNLKSLDNLYKNKDAEPEEIEAMFRREWAHFGAVFGDLADQLDLFAPKAVSRDVKAANLHAGRMAALMGKDATAPDGMVGESLQSWMEGWHEARDKRVEARRNLADDIAAAMKIVDEGGVVDGTGPVVKAVETAPKKAKGGGKKSANDKAEGVRLQAADDFAADQDPLTVGGITYMTQEGADEARVKFAKMREDLGIIGGPTEDEAAFS